MNKGFLFGLLITAASGCGSPPVDNGHVGGTTGGDSVLSCVTDGTCLPAPRTIAVGDEFACALRGAAPSGIACWGAVSFGELGNGTDVANDDPHNTPVNVQSITNAAEVVTGDEFGCARLSDGSVKCWGNGPGNGYAGPVYDPLPVDNVTGAVALAAGGGTACAVLSSGHIMCWGDNIEGQIGVGAQTSSGAAATVVSGIDDAVEVALGTRHVCARRKTGRVLCWGANDAHQLGVEPEAPQRSNDGYAWLPVEVPGISDAAGLYAGNSHTCVRRTSGTVSCWGADDDGELGDGTHGNASEGHVLTAPTDIPAFSGVVELALGSPQFVCARQATGGIRCVGESAYGGLGSGQHTTGEELVPVEVSGVGDAVQIASSGAHTCARRASGVVCWGVNDVGQLGDGTFEQRDAPVAVVGLQ